MQNAESSRLNQLIRVETVIFST